MATNRLTGRDLIAGLSVAVILIPQSLAYAEIAGLPIVMGLAAAGLPALAAAPFGSSRYLQTGPVAMTALLSFGALSAVAQPGSDEYIELALLLALVVGVVRVALGLLKAGAITNYMSPPVILGFTTSAAILIIASQIGSATGIVDVPEGLVQRLLFVLTHVGMWNWSAVGVTALVGLLTVGGRQIHPLAPGVLAAVLVGLWIGSQTGYTAGRLGEIPEGFITLSISMPWSRVVDLLIPGVVIATIGFAEATAISRSFAVQDREKWDSNRELIGQGVANVAAAVAGGFPVGGSFSRSSINRLAGARTRWSGAVTGVLVLAFMPFARVLMSLPRAVLSAIVIFAVYKLIRVSEIVKMFKVSVGQALVASSTAILTLVLAPRIDIAVILGMLIAGGVHLFRESSQLKIPSSRRGTVLTFQPNGVLYYASANGLYAALERELAENDDCTVIELDLSRLGRIDFTGVQTLQRFAELLENAELDFKVTNMPDNARSLFERAGGL